MNGPVSGSVFAGYRVIRPIGAGGMGEVYLAQHPRLPREDALKILREDISSSTEFRERFIREADVAAALSHPNIITVYDRGEFDNQLWIATQYIDGIDASRLIRDKHPAGVSATEVSSIIDAIASALDYAHGRGLMHRDVKPANILLGHLTREGRRPVYLADFGTARPLIEPNGLTETNLTIGTVAYASPEQLMGEALDGRADQYSLAATAYHLLTGGQLYEASNPIAVISKHLTAKPPRPSESRTELAPFDSVFQIALSREPSQRFATCGQFASALRSCINGDSQQGVTQVAMPVPAPATSSHASSAPPKSPSTKSKSRKTLIRAAITATMVAASSTGIYFFTQGNREQDDARQAQQSSVLPLLNGTYEIEFDDYKQTLGGAPQPPPRDAGTTSKLALESSCTNEKCWGKGVVLDSKNPSVAVSQSERSPLRMRSRSGKWEIFNTRQAAIDRCEGDGAQTVGPGSHTVYNLYELEPHSNGQFRGLLTNTVLTNECGMQGLVVTTPIHSLTRIGDVPTGLSIPEPPASLPDPTKPPQLVPGPTIDGAFKIEYLYEQQTKNETPLSTTPNNTQLWHSFRSACTKDRCIATGIELDDGIKLMPIGLPMVLSYRDGEWTTSWTLQPLTDCSSGVAGTQSTTTQYRLRPQDDGLLRGTLTILVLETGCSNNKAGDVYTTPITAVRIGGPSPTALNADPSLWLN